MLISNVSNAEVYVKAFAGRVNNNHQLQSSQLGLDPGFPDPDYTESKHANKLTQLTGGLGLGYTWDKVLWPSVLPNLKIGLELGANKNEGNYKQNTFTNENFLSNALLDAETTVVKVDNDYKLDLWAVFNLAEMFYFKIGPSYLKQEITATTYESNFPRKVNNIRAKDDKGFWGISFGTGVRYNINKVVGLFSEYTAAFYQKEKLSSYSYSGANSLDPGADPTFLTYHYDRKIKFNQSQFITGIVVNTDNLM